MTYLEFIDTFPEFVNLVDYPKTRVEFWLDFATNFVNTQRWSSMTNYGISLLTAHQLAMEKMTKNGQVKGVITSKTVDSVSYTQDVKLTTYAKAGYFNLTTYGIQYWNLVQMMGAGPISFL